MEYPNALESKGQWEEEALALLLDFKHKFNGTCSIDLIADGSMENELDPRWMTTAAVGTILAFTIAELVELVPETTLLCFKTLRGPVSMNFARLRTSYVTLSLISMEWCSGADTTPPTRQPGLSRC